MNRKRSRMDFLSHQINHIGKGLENVQLRGQKADYELHVALESLNFVTAHLCSEMGWDFAALVRERRSNIPLFALRYQASPEEKMLVNGKPKDHFSWDKASGADHYRYRFVLSKDVFTDFETTTETMVENPEGHSGVQVYPVYQPAKPESESSGKPTLAVAPTEDPSDSKG